MTPRLIALARSFPTLREAPLAEVEHLAEWLKGPAPGEGARQAGLFVLSVSLPASGLVALGLRAFDVHRALAVWDEEHRAAFLAWASAPWWP